MIAVEWNGRTYDLDLTGYTGRELHELEQRTGETWRRLFVLQLQMDPDAVRAPFWLTDVRRDPDLRWSDYDGPAVAVVMPHLAAVRAAVEAMGKAILPAPETSGSDASPSDADTPQPSSTD